MIAGYMHFTTSEQQATILCYNVHDQGMPLLPRCMGRDRAYTMKAKGWHMYAHISANQT